MAATELTLLQVLLSPVVNYGLAYLVCLALVVDLGKGGPGKFLSVLFTKE